MAAASITPYGTELPVTYELEDKGRLAGPLQVNITASGAFLLNSHQAITLDELGDIMARYTGNVVFLVEANAPAKGLIRASAGARASNWRAAFIVQRKERGL